ncbi:MAG: DUF1295 domain-containing protein, partial [Fulvivirga sp.]|nr:DUF1295 domain-containing protein [Fulvivirga sp.]
MINTIIDLAIILIGFAVFNFLLSLIFKRNDIADVAWGMGFIIVCAYSYYQFDLTSTSITLYLMIVIWGLRLSIYLGIRNSQKSEDFRYKQWRKEWGDHFYWRSFLQVYLLQMLILLVIALPVIISGFYSVPHDLTVLQWIAITGFAFGFCWEAIADYQLYKFKRKHKEGVMTKGLWKYSRHPNYFGEIVIWWSIFLFVVQVENGIWALVSPLLVTYLLVKVSGVPMLEKKYDENSDYR